MTLFQEAFWGPNGFEELRKIVKQGGDFCGIVASILSERSELEAHYAKSLSKLANKISKAARETFGTMHTVWQEISVEMENEADLHRRLGTDLSEDIVKPTRVVAENQHKTRKLVDIAVDKASKVMTDRRNEEYKAKKFSYSCARENERMQEQALDAKGSRGKVFTEKDVLKLETKRRRAEESAAKADTTYYLSCIKAERARQEWETAVYRASSSFQHLEEERLAHLQEVVQKYSTYLTEMGPSLTQNCEKLNEAVSLVDVTSDLQSIVEMKGTGRNIPEQFLPDFYAEDMGNIMKKERRKESLEKFIRLIKHDLELERKGKHGLENLAKVFQETPNFGDADAQQDVNDKLQHMRAMLTYLEATRFKLMCAQAELEDCVRPTHPLNSHLEQCKDKQGGIQTVLKVPQWVRMERRLSESSGSAGSDIPEYECIQKDQDNTDQIYANLPAHCKQSQLQCRALYDYTASDSEELSFHPGDILTICEKGETGWWRGELHGQYGFFPSTYVEELS